MNDRELVAKLEAMARYIVFSPQEAEACRGASRRIAELNRELATYLALEVEAAALVRSLDEPGGWLAVPRDELNAIAAARRLVDIGAWEENRTPTRCDTIEFRPLPCAEGGGQ